MSNSSDTSVASGTPNALSELDRDEQSVVNALYWWGVPTLFRAPLDPDPANADIALVGVPHSTGNGTTERDQHLGPRAVRHVSANGRRVHMGFELDPWSRCRINDLGDVPFPEANDNELCIERISDMYRRIGAAGARPVSIGGDHSITGGIVQALAGSGAPLTGGNTVALLHFSHCCTSMHTPMRLQIWIIFWVRKNQPHTGRPI